jgi:hypothetical protein
LAILPAQGLGGYLIRGLEARAELSCTVGICAIAFAKSRLVAGLEVFILNRDYGCQQSYAKRRELFTCGSKQRT